jgi:hypothetical protein
MEAVRFKTSVKNGVIKIPRKYLGKIAKDVQVLIYNEPAKTKDDYISYLLVNPLQIDNFQPLSREDIHERAH